MESEVLKRLGRKQWQEILDGIARDMGMMTTLVDPQGRILLHRGHYTEVCERIRSDDRTLSFVCGQTLQAMLRQAERSRRPVVDLCQIGLCKMLIPILEGERLLGAVTSCSLAPQREEPDPFLLAQELGIEEREATRLLESCPTIDEQRVEEAAQRWAERIQSFFQ